MHHQMAQVQMSNNVEKIFFGNVLTQYLRAEAVDEDPDFNMIIPTAPNATNITTIHGKDEYHGFSVTTTERQAHDASFLAHLYLMLNLQLQIGSRPTTQERMQLNE